MHKSVRPYSPGAELIHTGGGVCRKQITYIAREDAQPRLGFQTKRRPAWEAGKCFI